MIHAITNRRNRSPLRTLLRRPARALAFVREWNRRVFSRNELAALREHELRDLGLTAAQVTTEIDKPCWRL